MAKIVIALAVICTAYLASAEELSAGDVKIRYFHRRATNEYIDFTLENANEVTTSCGWYSSQPTVIIVHGVDESVESESTTTIAAAYLGRRDHNILALDYPTRAESGNMLTGRNKLVTNAGLVGEALGKLIDRLVEAGLDLSTLHLVGYKTGAHVAGHAARTANGTVFRITALDPYLGVFYTFNDDHLWVTDAKHVDVIHTNAVYAGLATSTGTVDFYPNSGYAPQPDCRTVTSLDLDCSSRSAYKFYAESVTNPTAFPAIVCESWTQFDAGKCTGVTDNMGFGYSLKNTGDFYLQTNAASPLSKGNAGLKYEGHKVVVESAKVVDSITNIFG